MSDAVTSTGILVYRKSLTGGPAPAAIVVDTVAIGNPAVVTTAAPHPYATHDKVTLAGVTGSTPDVNAEHTIVVIDDTHFTIPVAVTVAGADGTVTQGYGVIAEITEVTPGGMSRNKIDTSNHNEGRESNVLGILRNGDPGFKVNYVGSSASHRATKQDIILNRKAQWLILYPSGVGREGSGYVQNFQFDNAPVDGKQGVSITLVWGGIVTEYDGTEEEA